VKEADVLKKLREFLNTPSSSEVRYIRELTLREGLNRADLVSITKDEMHCYEIKSEADNLNRLIKQACSYVKVFDRITIVLAQKHLDIARKVLPHWWGFLVITPSGEFIQERIAKPNPIREAIAIAQVFTSDEAEKYLSLKIERKELRSVSKSLYRGMLPKNFGIEELRDYLVDSLYSRAAPSFA